MDYQRLITEGIDQWNRWRLQHPHQCPNLNGVNLSRAYLFEANLKDSHLRGANLSRACLIGADLSGADLSGADLRGAYFSEANLSHANLRQANLMGASLMGANLSQAVLAETQLAEANLEQANLTGTCLDAPPHPPITHLEPVQAQLETSQVIIPAIELEPPEFQPFTVPDVPAIPRAQQPTAEIQSVLEHCQRKLSEYYIGPMVTLMLEDILATHQPQTASQLVDLVADQLPDKETGRAFRDELQSALLEGNPRSRSSALTDAFIDQCQQSLADYYIAPMAQMVIQEILAIRHPTTPRQLAKLIAAQLPDVQAEHFLQQALWEKL
jgi:hypothetical protein